MLAILQNVYKEQANQRLHDYQVVTDTPDVLQAKIATENASDVSTVFVLIVCVFRNSSILKKKDFTVASNIINLFYTLENKIEQSKSKKS